MSAFCLPLVLLRTSDCLDPPDVIVRRFEPRDSILETIAFCAHSPIARRTTTESTPIIIPRLDSPARSLLAAKVLNALNICSRIDIKFTK